MKANRILPEDDNLFDNAFEFVIPDTSNADIDNINNDDYRELLVVNEFAQGRVGNGGDKYMYRIYPYEVSDTAKKYLFMKNFNPKVHHIIIYYSYTNNNTNNI